MIEIERAIRLKKELDALRPISPDNEQRIWQKFRLDWNYHSNSIEGNRLTYGETKALLLFNITAEGKPLRDHFEIVGHNEALKLVLEVVKEERPLTENFIRELHKIILKEPYEVDALTPEGKPAKKKIKIGEYKSSNNHVKTRTGEIFYFADHLEVPALMKELLEWYKLERDKNGIDPIIIAASFHYKFVKIHPFDDGNGRTARILMNFILMSYGYPPVVVKADNKSEYISALEMGDAGNLDVFVKYMASNLIDSIELMIAGAKGEGVEDYDDIDKKLFLLDKKLKGAERYKVKVSKDVKLEFFNSSILRLVAKIKDEYKLKFSDYYSSSEIYFSANSNRVSDEHLNSKLTDEKQAIFLFVKFSNFNFKDASPFDYVDEIVFEFLDFEIFTSLRLNRGLKFRSFYGEKLEDDKIKKIIKCLKEEHYSKIEREIEPST